ncbi:hypothetical protein Zm00014a_019949 [Zea mays]|uniref:Uncharacterized protein n=1 Tax=Zea mays TaxID=4577 RepID=A0A3L6FQ29_MAIZE|nr:hypothetical protein Zm00014a_019949 [Zea mays]
MRRGCFEPVTK